MIDAENCSRGYSECVLDYMAWNLYAKGDVLNCCSWYQVDL